MAAGKEGNATSKVVLEATFTKVYCSPPQKPSLGRVVMVETRLTDDHAHHYLVPSTLELL